MKSISAARQRKFRLGAAVASVALATTSLALQSTAAQATDVSLPPVHGGFDYQINGAYTPPSGVSIVSRDHKDSPAAGLYNICYINAFQTQPDDDSDDSSETPDGWGDSLLLHDKDGERVTDGTWDEVLLDISTAAKRDTIASKIEKDIDTCASKGFDALELDNYDSYTRSDGLLTAAEAQSYIKTLSAYGHSKGLAVAQKNTLELAANHAASGLDFAIVEECGDQDTDECAQAISDFGNNVIFIEYSDAGMAKACQYGDRVSVVQRDRDVDTPSSSHYVRKTCTGTGGGTGSSGHVGPIKSGISGYCLDVPGNANYNGAKVTVATCNGSAEQKWTAGTDGTLKINNKCLDVQYNGTANGSLVELYDCNGQSNQKWTTGSNSSLIGASSGRCLDDPQFFTDGHQLDIWDCNAGNNQKWTLP
ncbi:endo alpha-1,4 polygalactosaminidase [Streptomyces griseofuscus]|uniref:endo alpha-1,4 polygalactosaminidase n=1 Tax=Streptomyces griseofuscus TaxID=146922 RepID=UPI00340C7505